MLELKAIVSKNTNSFGLYHHYLVAVDGRVYEGLANQLNKKSDEDVVRLPPPPAAGDAAVLRCLTLRGFECPAALPPDTSGGLPRKLWGDAARDAWEADREAKAEAAAWEGRAS